jgi:hypothetical protein
LPCATHVPAVAAGDLTPPQILQLDVKRLFRSATDTVDLLVPQEQGMLSLAKKDSAIK